MSNAIVTSYFAAHIWHTRLNSWGCHGYRIPDHHRRNGRGTSHREKKQNGPHLPGDCKRAKQSIESDAVPLFDSQPIPSQYTPTLIVRYPENLLWTIKVECSEPNKLRVICSGSKWVNGLNKGPLCPADSHELYFQDLNCNLYPWTAWLRTILLKWANYRVGLGSCFVTIYMRGRYRVRVCPKNGKCDPLSIT